MRTFLFISALTFSLLLSGNINVASAQSNNTCQYAVVLKFNSIGMGVPNDSLLRNYIDAFKQKNKIKKITACRIGPMGKEGEYWLAFSLKELSKKQKSIFKTELRAVTEQMTDRGNVSYEENEQVNKNDISGRVSAVEVIF
ncbi:MAG: hypothetical protein JST81_12570 [Bacteroidetes bacterium]|jgi:hypothetical protein|nr:hypothetical protein [Bacteroidota bacterium]